MRTTTRTRPVAAAAALVLVALAAVLLPACGGSGEPPAESSPSIIAVTPAAATGTIVQARVGDTVVVTLAANATTGYEWTFAPGETFTIERSEYVPDENPEQLVGKGGAQLVTLKVTKPGSSNLTGTYARSWEARSPDAQPDVTLTIDSSD
jgi:predicted secreted protein